MPPIPSADDVRAARKYLARRMWGAWARRAVMLAILVAVFVWMRRSSDYRIDGVVEFEMSPSFDRPPKDAPPASPTPVNLVVTARGAMRVEPDGRRVFLARTAPVAPEVRP